MKKNLILTVALACVLTAGLATGCTKEAPVEDTTKVEDTATTDDTTTDDTTASTDYLTWTNKEWAVASEEDKAAATKLYLVETMKMAATASGQEVTPEMEAAITDEAVTQAIPSLDAAFAASEEMTLQAVLDAASSAMDSAEPTLGAAPAE